MAAFALAARCWVLLDLISLVLTGRVEDPDGTSNWLVFAQRLGAFLTGVLFTGAGPRLASPQHRHLRPLRPRTPTGVDGPPPPGTARPRPSASTASSS